MILKLLCYRLKTFCFDNKPGKSTLLTILSKDELFKPVKVMTANPEINVLPHLASNDQVAPSSWSVGGYKVAF